MKRFCIIKFVLKCLFAPIRLLVWSKIYHQLIFSFLRCNQFESGGFLHLFTTKLIQFKCSNGGNRWDWSENIPLPENSDNIHKFTLGKVFTLKSHQAIKNNFWFYSALHVTHINDKFEKFWSVLLIEKQENIWVSYNIEMKSIGSTQCCSFFYM